MKKFLLVFALVLNVSAVAVADDDEGETVKDEAIIAKMKAAIEAKGCKGGKYLVNDGRYFVDDAECEGNEFEISFDKDFKITEVEME